MSRSLEDRAEHIVLHPHECCENFIVKDVRGRNQIEMDRTCSQSEYSFLQFVISKRQIA